MLSGFQAAGTLGRLLQEGREMVRIQGEPVRVRAGIRYFDAYSGHADAGGLVNWAKGRGAVAGKVFLLHGEPDSTAGLKKRLSGEVFAADQIVVPGLDQGFILSAGTATDTGEPCRIPTEAATAFDWHNMRAELLNDLELKLEEASSDGERRRILDRLRVALGARG
jgi:metallo-beta-lactamase family protein